MRGTVIIGIVEPIRGGEVVGARRKGRFVLLEIFAVSLECGSNGWEFVVASIVRKNENHLVTTAFRSFSFVHLNKNGGIAASVFIRRSVRSLSEPPSRMCEQGVDEAGLRGQLVAQRLRSAVLAGDLVQQPFELGDVAI